MTAKFLRPALLAASLVTGCYSLASAQNSVNTNTTYIDSQNGYNMGIGLTNTYAAGFTSSYLGFNVSRIATNSWKLGTDTNGNGGSLLMTDIFGNFKIYTIPVANAANPQTFSDSQIGSLPARLTVNADGQVQISGQLQIGTTKPNQSGYLFSVAGRAVVQSLYVTAVNTWADFVFEPTYKPMALPALENYLLTNKHLPYIPSAKEVEANGYSVTEMDAKLLQTVEELTLQLIELNKQVKQLQSRVEQGKQ